MVTSLRSTPGLDPVGNEIRHIKLFILAQKMCFCWFSPLSSAKPSLCRRGAGEKEKESARGTMGRGKREERREAFSLFPSSPGRFLFFHLYCYFFLRYPAGAFAEKREFSAFPKNQHFQIPIQFLVLDIGCNS